MVRISTDQVSGGTGGGPVNWGSIGGTLSSQTDLQTALNGKSGTSHTHDYSASYAPLSHTHTASQVSDSTSVGRSLLTASDAPAARSAIGAGTSSFSGAYSALSGVPSTFAPSAHASSHVGSDAIQTASGSQSGLLSSADWTTFNGKVTFPGFGTSGTTACVGNDSRLSDARIASDVYSWAKAASKPTYTYTEVGAQAALSGTGFVKISGTTISYDNSTYLTGNQSITLSGDASGSGTTSITVSIPSFAGSAKGLVPVSAGGTTNFLRADGTWAAPPSGGSPAWGSISGTLSDQTDLNTALTGKAPTASPSFTGTITDVQDSQTALTLTRFFVNAVGSYNGYLQSNWQNKSNGASASTDLICTTDTGSDSAEYIDLGINGSGFSGTWGSAKDGYLYVDGGASGVGDLVMGTAQANTYASIQVGGGGAIADGIKCQANYQSAFNVGLEHFVGGLIFSQTATKTHGNSASTVTLTNTGRGTWTLPANYLIAGRVLRIRAGGYMTTMASSPGNFTILLKLGSTTVLTTTAAALVVNTTTRRWELDCTLVCYATGASGTVWGEGRFETSNNSEATCLQYPLKKTATSTIDTTASQAVDLQATWATANASNSITCVYLTVEGY